MTTLRNVQAAALISSGVARAAGELLQIGAGGPTPLTGVLAAVALLSFALGLTGIWSEARHSGVGILATVATIVGALSFVVLALHAVFVLGAPATLDVARTLPFMLSAIATLVGVSALAIFLIRSPRYPGWIGVVLIATVLGSITSSILDSPPIIQPLIDIVMAVSFVQFGLAMRKPDAYTSIAHANEREGDAMTGKTWRDNDTP